MQTDKIRPEQETFLRGRLPATKIRTPDRRLRVFISSTLGELADERLAVSRAISTMRLTPVMFELGARPYPPTEVYQAYLAQADVFIGLYWERYGEIIPDGDISGLEEEFDLSGGLPRLLYIKAPAGRRDERLTSLLTRIESESSTSYRYFRTASELARLVRDDLAVLLSEHFAAGRAATTERSTSATRGPRPLPVNMTSLLGRERAIGEVAELVERPDVQLVTLTGPGGVGKTRLAIAAGERLRDRFAAGTVFVPLDDVTDPNLVLDAIGRATGANLAGVGSSLEALVERFGDNAWLMILDNLEQVADVARDLMELLNRCPRLAAVATSRTVLRLRAEREYPVAPLPVPADAATVSLAELRASPAVALFVDRARTVRPAFALTDDNAVPVVEICRRLEGLPLAIELAAARTRLLEPAALLDRLAASLDALGSGAVDLPERQRTLRATVQWSIGLLSDDERSLLEVMAVFVDGWSLDAVAGIAGLDEDEALQRSEELARHSLIYVDDRQAGSRNRMLDTVREFVAERLAARPDVNQVCQGHADFYRALAEQADYPLRTTGQALDLDPEIGNLAACVHWYLAHEPGLLPHLFRVLWLFWSQRDLEREARSWVEQLAPTTDTLDAHARAELVFVATVLAIDTGHDEAALAAREGLAPLIVDIQDPFLHAVCRLAMAWTLPIFGDLDGALREATESLEELRGYAEPVFSGIAAFTAGALAIGSGRYEIALDHLRETCAMAEQAGSDWIAAGSRVEQGILAVQQNRPEDARPLLEEALDLSLAGPVTQFVALSLAGYACLAYAEGDLQQAAQLEGAAEGLRHRVGLPAWPFLRTVERELVSRLREDLGAEPFDQAFAAGSRLTQRQAVEIAGKARAAPLVG